MNKAEKAVEANKQWALDKIQSLMDDKADLLADKCLLEAQVENMEKQIKVVQRAYVAALEAMAIKDNALGEAKGALNRLRNIAQALTEETNAAAADMENSQKKMRFRTWFEDDLFEDEEQDSEILIDDDWLALPVNEEK